MLKLGYPKALTNRFAAAYLKNGDVEEALRHALDTDTVRETLRSEVVRVLLKGVLR